MYVGLLAMPTGCVSLAFSRHIANILIAHVVNVLGADDAPKTTAPAYSNASLVSRHLFCGQSHTVGADCNTVVFPHGQLRDHGILLLRYCISWWRDRSQQLLASLQRARCYETRRSAHFERAVGVRLVGDTILIAPSMLMKIIACSFKPYDFQSPRYTHLIQQTGNSKVPTLFRFSRYSVLGWQRKRNPELPSNTQAQLEAIDAVQFTLKKNSIQLPTVKGDMLFVNDMALMHARNGFDEGGEKLKRHLVKMYLRDPEKGWDIPEWLEREWKPVYNKANRPDGTRVETWPLGHRAGLEETIPDNG